MSLILEQLRCHPLQWGGVPPTPNKEGGTPSPLSRQRQAPTPLRLHAHGHGFVWSHDGAALPTQEIGRGVRASLKCKRGYPTPHSKKRVGVPLPPCSEKDRLPPPLRLHALGHDFAWSHDGAVVSRSVIRLEGWEPLMCPEGYPPPPPLQNKRGGPPTPCLKKEWLLPPSLPEGDPHHM